MITNQELRKMAEAYRDNGEFTVSGRAMIEKAGIDQIIEESDIEYSQVFIDGFVSGSDDWDGISEMAYHIAVNEVLSNSEIFVLETLDKSDREQSLCYRAEMSNEEQAEFLKLHQMTYNDRPSWGFWVTLVDDETGDLEPTNRAFFTDQAKAETEAERRNEADPELVEGQSWQVR